MVNGDFFGGGDTSTSLDSALIYASFLVPRFPSLDEIEAFTIRDVAISMHNVVKCAVFRSIGYRRDVG